MGVKIIGSLIVMCFDMLGGKISHTNLRTIFKRLMVDALKFVRDDSQDNTLKYIQTSDRELI